MSEGFFSRWSRRKHEAGQNEPEVKPTPASSVTAGDEAPDRRLGEAEDLGHPDGAPPPLPTLDDVTALTPASDFQPFMQHGVGAEVRNAAMKKLFADPHFNVMDGLDIYIGDYSQPDPMPAGMLRQMASAQFLKLVPEEAPDAGPMPVEDTQVVAQSPDASARAGTPSHDHPDLQLQPDPASADPQPGPGPR